MYKIFTVLIAMFVACNVYADTPINSTSVNQSLKSMLSATGKWKRILVDPGSEAQVRSDLGVMSSDSPVFTGTVTAPAATIAGVSAPYIAQTNGTGTGITLSGTTTVDNVLDIVGTGTPAAPLAGTARLSAATGNGITRVSHLSELGVATTMGRDNIFTAKNTSGSTINKGQVVYVTGSVGAIPTMALARADATATSGTVIGIAITDVLNNAFTGIMLTGVLESINTSAFTAGDVVYVSAITAGSLTNVKPAYPNYVKGIGTILNSGVGNGSILINVAPFLGNTESGTDAANYTFAGNVGVGTSTPATKLHVVGTVTATSATIGGVVSLLAQDGSAFIDTNTNPGINVGTGTVTTSGIETIVKYNSTGTFTVPMGVTSLKVLVVGGGAGGDGGISAAVYGHGGGGGRVTYRSSFSVTEGSSYTVTIGTGGTAGAMDAQASPGVQSAFGTLTAAGGTQANNIGSGGDGGDSGKDIDSVVTNYNGLTDSTWGGAGGAGADGVGGTVTDAAGGTGGVGYSSSITGSSTAYGAGGDGSGTGTGVPPAVAANLGLGGHGHGTSPRAGGSGVVIIRFMTSYDTLTVNDKFRIDTKGRVSIGTTTANNNLTIANDGVNGVGIDLRSDDTDLTNVNNFSIARLFADFTSGSYADSRLYLQTATGDNTWKTGLTIKDGSVGIGIGTPTTTLQVIGTVTATGFSGNGAGLTGKENTLSNSAGLAAALSDETGTNTVVFSSGSTQTNATFTGNSNFPGSGIWNSSGNVGIGAITPGEKLEVSGNIRVSSTDSRIRFVSPSSSSGEQYGRIEWWNEVLAGIMAKISAVREANPLAPGALAFYTSANVDTSDNGGEGAWSEKMRITSAGNVGIGTDTPIHKLTSMGVLAVLNNGNGGKEIARFFNQDPDSNDASYIFLGEADAPNKCISFGYNDAGNYGYFAIYGDTAGDGLNLCSGNKIGIGTTTPSNILTLPIASATDPIADAWTNHCLADYKDIGTETTEMIQLSANDKIKSVPVSSFTKKALVSDEEAEREVKQKYQGKIRESAKADLELYTAETGVSMRDNSYVDELVNSMWETKADKLTLVEANKQKLIAEKKALPKFQRKNYGIVAEDAPPEAQVLREDGSLQGVDTSVLVGILWANAQKQEERISALESEITNLKQRLQTAGIP